MSRRNSGYFVSHPVKAMNNLCPGYKLEEFDFSRLIDRN